MRLRKAAHVGSTAEKEDQPKGGGQHATSTPPLADREQLPRSLDALELVRAAVQEREP